MSISKLDVRKIHGGNVAWANNIFKQVETQVRASSDRIDYFQYHKSRYIRILELVNACASSDAKVLDVGSYPFQMLFGLSLAEYDAWGVDNYDPKSAKGKKTLASEKNLNLKICNILENPLPFPDKHFSIVIFSEVIEHLANPLKILFEINRVLREDGTLILTTPNLYSAGKIYKYLVGKESYSYGHFENFLQQYTYGYPGHIKEYSNRGLKELLNHIGFKSVQSYYEFYDPSSKKSLNFLYKLIPMWRPYQIVVAKKFVSTSLNNALKNNRVGTN